MSNHRRFVWVVAVCHALAIAPFVCAVGCAPSAAQYERFHISDQGDSTEVLSREMELRIEAFCSDCHALPHPDSFPRDRWHFGVRKGYEFYAKSGRNDLDPPPLHKTLAYYRARAPEQVAFPPAEEAAGEPGVNFYREKLYLDSEVGALPEIAHLNWTRLAPEEDPVLLASDMRHGHVVAIDLKPEARAPPRLLAQLRNPGRIEVCDLDGNGQLDLIVADLGSYLPADHDRGRVVLLRRRPGTDAYQAVELAAGLGRVADVRPIDVDGNGKLDLIVAEFGWQQTGRLLLLRNVSQPGDDLRFELEEIDDRPGAIDVRVHDFTGDGRVDFAALVSQEYQSIDLFLNTGSNPGQFPFARYNLWAGPDLSFGTSGIELVDLNQNGNMDILYTNGDAFDYFYATPWHGVGWLENRGGLKFVHHRLTEMPGAYRALTGDFTGDGNLDILAVAWLPPNVRPLNLQQSPLASIVLLEQTEPGVFARHTLQWDSPYHPTVAIGDFNGNGALDFAVASGPNVAEARQQRQESHYLTVWWNQAGVE